MQLAQLSTPFLYLHASLAVALGVGILLYYSCWIVYILYLHPLANYPGPKLWLISRIPYSRGLRQGTLVHRLRELHDVYGPVVRFGINELSFTNPGAWKEIYGFHGGPDKDFDRDSRFYQPAPNGIPSILSANNEALVRRYVEMLIAKLHLHTNGVPINITNYFQFTTFDIIGDLMYGESFGCLEREEYHTWLKVIPAFFRRLVIGASFVSLFPAVRPWLRYIIPKRVQEETLQRFAFTVEKVGQRLAMGEAGGRADFMTYMVRTHGKGGFSMARGELDATFDLLATAGAETTATALSGTVQYLLRNPPSMKRLQDEIRGAFNTPDDITVVSTSNLPYLTAALNEGMRLCPPAPSMRPREVPEGGALICGQWLPAGVSVGIPPWSSSRSARNFAKPDAFIPERWLKPEEGGIGMHPHEPKAFHPFSYGPRDCLGRALGWAEMRLILAMVLWHFDLENKSEGQAWENQKVFVMWDKEPMMVTFRKVAR